MIVEDKTTDNEIEEILNILNHETLCKFYCSNQYSVKELVKIIDIPDPTRFNQFKFEDWIDKSQEIIDEEVVKLDPNYLKDPNRNGFSLSK
jgi:hypothetical protein